MAKIKHENRKGKGDRFSSGSSSKPASVSTEKLPPIFSFKFNNDKYCLSVCDKDEKAAFADKLHRLSVISWQDIKGSHRHGMGYEKISRDSLKSAIPVTVPPDANLIAFRFSGMKPMVERSR